MILIFIIIFGFFKGRHESVLLLADGPLFHTLDARMDGRVASVNGLSKLKIIPTSKKVKMPIFVGGVGKLLPDICCIYCLQSYGNALLLFLENFL